jgi:hypothetical protein
MTYHIKKIENHTKKSLQNAMTTSHEYGIIIFSVVEIVCLKKITMSLTHKNYI